MDTRRASTIVVTAVLCLMAVMGPASAAITSAPQGWTQVQGNAGHTGAVDAAAAPAYRQAWALSVPLGGPGDQFGLSAPVIDPTTDTAVSVGPNQVLGVDLHTGAQSFTVQRLYGPSVPAAITQIGDAHKAIVYTQGWGDTVPTAAGTPTPSASASPSTGPSASGGPSASPGATSTTGGPHLSQLVAIDFTTHQRLWDPVELAAHATVRPVRAGVVVADNTAYVGDSGGSIYAVDLQDGKLRWTVPAGGAIASAIAVSGDLVLVATQGTRTVAPTVVALKASDGSVVWRYDAEPVGALATAPVVVNGAVYASFSDGDVVALDLTDGSVRWSSRINAPVLPIGGLAVSGDALYVFDIVGQLYRFDTADGTLVWTFALNAQSTSAPPVVAGDHVLVATDTGLLAAFDPDTGHLVWESGPQGGLLRGLAPTADLIVAVKGGTSAGMVAYEHDDAGALTDVVSPTVFNAGTNALGFFVVAIPLFALALIGGRLLGRRMGPAFIYEDDDGTPIDPLEDGAGFVSNRDPNRPAGGFRAPSTNGAKDAVEPRRGLLANLFAPRVSTVTSMPKITSSLARGFVAVLSSPGLLLTIPILVLAEWLAAVALGFQGPFGLFSSALATPPTGTIFDEAISSGIFGQQTGLAFVLAFVALRAVIMALMITAIVVVLEDGNLSVSTVLRGIKIFPVTLAVGILSMAFVTFATILGGYLGLGIGLLLWAAAQVLTLYLFAFAPVMAAAERRSMPESLSRSIRAGRMPGAGNLTFASMYVVVSVVLLQVTGRPYRIGVNPTPAAWAFVLVANVLQVCFIATLAFRYLSISDEVPAAPEPKQRAARGRRR